MKVVTIEKRTLSISELAKYLGISTSLIHRELPEWITNFGIKVYKIGGQGKRGKYLVDKLDVDQKLLPSFQVR
jgi:predicted transcriptional regulator